MEKFEVGDVVRLKTGFNWEGREEQDSAKAVYVRHSENEIGPGGRFLGARVDGEPWSEGFVVESETNRMLAPFCYEAFEKDIFMSAARKAAKEI